MNSKIEKMRDFLSKCPFLDEFTNNVTVDWCNADVGNYGIMPTGESIIERHEDILGNVIMLKQYNVSLFAMRFTIDDVVRIESCGFLEKLTMWIEEQSILGNAPSLGDEPETESITAQNGMLFELSTNGQTGRYQVQINALFKAKYRKDDNLCQVQQ